MQVFVTPDHDTTMINSEIVELLQVSDPTDEELNELDTLDTDDEHYDCYGDEVVTYGDEYANEVIADLGFFTAHYGEL